MFSLSDGQKQYLITIGLGAIVILVVGVLGFLYMNGKVSEAEDRAAVWENESTSWKNETTYWKSEAAYWESEAVWWQGEAEAAMLQYGQTEERLQVLLEAYGVEAVIVDAVFQAMKDN